MPVFGVKFWMCYLPKVLFSLTISPSCIWKQLTRVYTMYSVWLLLFFGLTHFDSPSISTLIWYLFSPKDNVSKNIFQMALDCDSFLKILYSAKESVSCFLWIVLTCMKSAATSFKHDIHFIITFVLYCLAFSVVYISQLQALLIIFLLLHQDLSNWGVSNYIFHIFQNYTDSM